MNKKEIINNIEKEIIQLEQLINNFRTNDNLHIIEIDICHDKLKNMYGELISLKQFANKNIENRTLIADNKSHKESESETVTESEIKPTIIEDAVEEIIEEKEIEILEEEEKVIQAPSKVHAAEDKPKKKTKNTKYRKPTGGYSKDVIGDSIERKNQSVNDIIAQNKFDKDISSKFNTRVINDINKAININDRIWFTKTLFNGNSDSFKKTISELNSSSDLDTALK